MTGFNKEGPLAHPDTTGNLFPLNDAATHSIICFLFNLFA